MRCVALGKLFNVSDALSRENKTIYSCMTVRLNNKRYIKCTQHRASHRDKCLVIGDVQRVQMLAKATIDAKVVWKLGSSRPLGGCLQRHGSFLG